MFTKYKSSLTFNFFTIILLLIFSSVTSERIEARIKLKGSKNWEIVYNDFRDEDIYVATAYYTDSLLEVGWDKLAITTNSIFSDEIQAEAAGRLEGELTKYRIYDHYLNIVEDFPKNDKVSEFLEKQESFVFDSMKKNGKNDPMLYNAYLIKIQYNAIMEQYNISIGDDQKKLTKYDFHIMNYVAELPDIYDKFSVEEKGETDYFKMTKEDLEENFLKRTHCSSLFKSKNDLSEIFLDIILGIHIIQLSVS